MIGQLWEWCLDVWHDSYGAAPTDGSANRTNADRQPRRVLRGGAWDSDGFRLRSCYRSFDWRHLATDHFGLRIVVSD